MKNKIVLIIAAACVLWSAPAVPADTIKPGEVTLVAIATFGTGESELDPEMKTEVAALVKRWKYTTQYGLSCIGHTDNVGDPESNKALSKKRAEKVAGFLNGMDIDVAWIYATGVGQDMPLETNSSEEGRAKNRRVEISIVPVAMAQ